MKDIPIIFSGPMVSALWDDRKTKTRRLAWREFERAAGEGDRLVSEIDPETRIGRVVQRLRPSPWTKVNPGDRLWVRENWGCPSADRPGIKDGRKPQPGDRIVYAANPADAAQWQPGHPGSADFVWRPSIHLPRWASRLTLIVTATRIERLQEISEADALAEGVVYETADPPFYYVPGFEPHSITACETYERPQRSFAKLWDHLHGTGAWAANPEVVALSFAVHKANIDHLYDPAAGAEEVGQWHAAACPLHEIDESDCAYDETQCNCGFQLEQAA